MNLRLVSRLLGVILATLAGAFVVCFVVSLFPSPIAEERSAGRGFLICAAAASALAVVMIALGSGAETRLLRKEALAVIGLGWFAASLVGALPYYVIDPSASFLDGFFEAASGLTTTGASVYADVEVLPHSLLFWRALSQWLGGMGVVVFFVAILGHLGAGAKILYAHEASGSTADFEEPRVRSAVLDLWLVYLALSAACAAVFLGGGMSLYDALCHMFATVSTGGFSTRNASFAAFGSPFLEWSATLFMMVGGCSLLLVSHFAHGRLAIVRRNTELRAFVALFLGSALAMTPFILSESTPGGWSEALRAAAFQTASILTTTGFATADFDLWPPFPKLLLLALMVVGGCAASTSGGVKVARIVVALRALARSIELEFRPRLVRRIRMNGAIVGDPAVNDVLVFLVLVGVLCLASVPLASIFEPGLSFEAALSSVFACLFNIGPGFGEVGPARNYGGLHDYTKAFLALLMIMGRLELYAVLVLFFPSLWRTFR